MTSATGAEDAQSGTAAPLTARELAGIDDGVLRNYCTSAAWLIDHLNHFAVHEPDSLLSDLDRTFKSKIFPAPMSYTHELMGHFLEGARHGLLAIVRLFSPDDAVHIPVAVITRQIVEYCACAYYLADNQDAPEMRLAKMVSLYRSSLVRRTLPNPAIDAIYADGTQQLDNWRSLGLLPDPAPRFTTIEDAITNLLDSFTGGNGKVAVGHYRRLSGLVHAGPRDLTALLEPTWRDSAEMNAVHYCEAAGDVAVALRSVFAAVSRVIAFRAPPSQLERDMAGIYMGQFALMIEELTIRLGDFWKSQVFQLVGAAYASKQQEMPRLADVFPDLFDANDELITDQQRPTSRT